MGSQEAQGSGTGLSIPWAHHCPAWGRERGAPELNLNGEGIGCGPCLPGGAHRRRRGAQGLVTHGVTITPRALSRG